jgi:O-antigen/teichoic acid export membrane protein
MIGHSVQRWLPASAEAWWILGGAVSSLTVRVLALALTFLTTLFLARLLGAEAYGQYAYAMSWFAVCTPFVGFGLAGIMTREIAASGGDGAAAVRAALVRFLLMVTMGSALVVAGGLAGAVILLCHAGWVSQTTAAVLLLVALLLPLTSVAAALGAVQNGLRRILESLLPTQVLHPAVLCGGAGIGLAAWGDGVASGVTGLLFQIVGAVAALGLAANFLGRQVPWRAIIRAPLMDLPQPPRELLLAGLLLVGSGLATVVRAQADILLLGSLIGPEAAGPYHAASRTAMLLSVLHIAGYAALGPQAASKLRRGDAVGLQRDVDLFMLLTVVPMLPVTIVFLLEPAWVLGLFGEGFASAATPFRILTVAWLFQIATGPAYLLLISALRERDILLGAIVGACLNLPLNLLLVPSLGATGAAIATGLAMTAQKSYMVHRVERATGLGTTCLIYRRLPFRRVRQSTVSAGAVTSAITDGP